VKGWGGGDEGGDPVLLEGEPLQRPLALLPEERAERERGRPEGLQDEDGEGLRAHEVRHRGQGGPCVPEAGRGELLPASVQDGERGGVAGPEEDPGGDPGVHKGAGVRPDGRPRRQGEGIREDLGRDPPRDPGVARQEVRLIGQNLTTLYSNVINRFTRELCR
jgi:hypothetical protein